MDDRIKRIPPSRLQTLPELTPPSDPVLTYLLERAVEGNLPVYFAAVPLELVKPFSDSFDPRRHPVGVHAIAAVQQRWKNQRFTNLVVYPQGNVFIMSDDYITYYACLEGNSEYVPCWVLGACTNESARDVQGPIRKEDVRGILLGSVPPSTGV